MVPDAASDPKAGQQAARDPIAVIRPYMVDLDPKVRANAAAALAVISVDYPAAAVALVDMWMSEKEGPVQDQIERDLTGIGGAARKALVERLTTLEHDEVPDRRANALYCRGRLRVRGIGEGTAESLDALIALTAERKRRPEDADAAEAALARLTTDELTRAAAVIRTRLCSTDDWTRDQTYALLGRLRAAGSPLGRRATISGGNWLAVPRTPGDLLSFARDWRQRVQAAGGVARDPVARQARRFSAQFVWTATAWGAIGACLMSIHLAATLDVEPPPGFYTMYFLAVIVSSIVLAAAAVRRLSPLWMHYDREAAGLHQAIVAGFWVFGPALVGVGILLASISFSNSLRNWVVSLLMAPVAISAFVAGIRLGTILGYNLLGRARSMEGVSIQRFWHSSSVGALLQTLVGASCGVLIAAALLASARHLHPHGHLDEVSRLIEGLWLFLTPTSAAIAAALSSVDRISTDPQEAPRPTRAPDVNWGGAMRHPLDLYRTVRTTVTTRRVFAAALLIPLGLALTLVVHDVRYWKPRIEMAPPGAHVTALQPITEIPVERDFRAAFPQRIFATIPERTSKKTATTGPTPDLTLVLYEWTPSGVVGDSAPDCSRRTNRRVMTSDDTKIDQYIGWGCYSILVGSQDQVGGIGRFSSVSFVLDARAIQAAGLTQDALPRDDVNAEYTLKLDLNVGKAPSAENAAFEGGGTTAVLHKVPADRKLIVRYPAAVQITASPIILRVSETRDAQAKERDEPSDTDSAEPSMRKGDELLQIELRKGAEVVDQGNTDEPKIERVLDPGEYTIYLTRERKSKDDTIEHPVALNVMSVRRTPSPPPPSRNPPTIEWPIPALLPGSYDFRVPVRQTVAVEIPPVYEWAPFNPTALRVRYLLELKQLKGGDYEVVSRVGAATGSREQIIQRALEPGVYRCSVSLVGSGTRSAEQMTVSPPRVTISLLGSQ